MRCDIILTLLATLITLISAQSKTACICIQRCSKYILTNSYDMLAFAICNNRHSLKISVAYTLSCMGRYIPYIVCMEEQIHSRLKAQINETT